MSRVPTSADAASTPVIKPRYRFPAEWEPHAATWIAWPHNAKDWPGKFGAIPWVYAEIVRALAQSELVRIIARDTRQIASIERLLKKNGVDATQTRFFVAPTDRCWARDFGPIFLERLLGKRREIIIGRFHFNAWAKYPNWRRDNAVAPLVARREHREMVECRHNGRAITLEGGALDVNGRGSILVAEECLLDHESQPRNPFLDRRDNEEFLSEWLGAKNVIWLGRGIAGDDTGGHVDDFCRFVSPETIVLCREKNGQDPNHGPLEENRERLESARLENGARPELAFLPMPRPIVFDGVRVPASYANFYITNDSVLVPTFNDPADRQALGILEDLFPGREVVGIHAVDLVWGFGTLHCLSQQEPKAVG